ncbi:MAG: DEAD/DEAH box helicase family protein [Candidatus Babeliaceae bacterium]|nr:DEAD/DEAH box helicase family protein [Candidatus Babeliaceae bacterium]
MLQLKEYQQRALDTLRAYFQECDRTGDANLAFYSITRNVFGQGIPYNPAQELPALPYICLRVPTGGGKTLVACHSVEIAASELLKTDNPVVLWLVPSNAIREQTLTALKNRNHPYRQALESTIGSVSVMSIEDALYVKRAQLDSETTVIVSTLQAFRVNDTVGYRVYRDSGDLMDHFVGLSTTIEERLEKNEAGKPQRTLANVLAIRRPAVIVDEAHNARTPLSFETLARFSPSCIIEFTATPAREDHPSNVLHSVSALELKAEQMIKMPIRLETRANWKELVADAVAWRKMLERIGVLERRETGEYIRPIMLIQAQSRSRNQETITVEVVKQCLLDDHDIPEDQIAIATGDTREIENVDLFAEDCKINYIITVQALREGWDCSYAYVLCSVAEMHATTAVEQILGRIMRLPSAKQKNHAELNMAYAFSASQRFHAAASALTDALVENGFERQVAKDLIVQAPHIEPGFTYEDGKPFLGSYTVMVAEPPPKLDLTSTTSEKVTYEPESAKLTFHGIMEETEREEIKKNFATENAKAAVDKLYRLCNGLPEETKGTPSERGIKFEVPVLAIKQGDLLEQFEDTHYLDHPWDLSKCVATLSEKEYSTARPESQHGEVTIADDGQIKASFISELHEQMSFLSGSDITVGQLANWLDRRIPHKDISPTESGIFISNLLQHLVSERGISVAQLAHDRYRLRTAVEKKMNNYRDSARVATYQSLLDIGSQTPLVVTPGVCFSYNPNVYAPSQVYRGRFEFNKHYYPEIGDLNSEEFECAQVIDQRKEVDYWVRNLELRPRHSFWLQTKTDKFYPDFVCKLTDSRFLVIEYKGAHLMNEDTREKQALGELWEARSNGRCLFLLVNDRKFDMIERKLR